MGHEAGDSTEQRSAEPEILRLVGELNGATLNKRRIELPEGGWLEVDGASDSPAILCEAWAHQGKAKSAQKNKVMTDALKLLYARSLLHGDSARMILAFADDAAAAHFRGESWMARALEALGVETVVVDLPAKSRETIRAAQRRQYR